MAAFFPKIIPATWCQNVFVNNLQICSYCTKPRLIKNPSTATLKRGTGGRSSFNGTVCTVFGANGFIGKVLCSRLGSIGTQLILPHRCDPYHMKELKVVGDLGQVVFLPFHLKDEESIIKSMKYSNVVINLIGANYETSNFSLKDVHVDGSRTLAKLAKQCNVEQFIHVSCLSASEHPTPIWKKGGSEILKTKWAGELAVKEEFPEATIVRPSIICGRYDKFVCHYLARLRANSRGLRVALWEEGEKTEKQPVFVKDVVSGIVAIIRNPDAVGKTYQFVGPQRYKLKELVSWIHRLGWENVHDNKPPVIRDISYTTTLKLRLAFLSLIHNIHPTGLTWDAMELQYISDIVDPDLPTLEDLGISPTKLDDYIEYAVAPMKRNPYGQNVTPRSYAIHSQ